MAFSGIVNPDPLTAFGELSMAQNNPRIQLQFPYNINTEEVNTTTTGSGTVSFSQPFAVCSTTAATSSSATLSSKNNIHYRTGQGGLVIFTCIFTTGATGSTQVIGVGDASDGLFFGYNGTAFGINRRYNGSNNWTDQTAWNQDKMDGTGASGMTLVPTNGNVYKIQYQWLGFGNINFYIENPATGLTVLVHQIQYPNQFTTTTLLNPTKPIMMQATNTTNNTNIVMKSPSMAAFVQGILAPPQLINNINNSKAVTTQASILTIRNNTTFNSITNYKAVHILQLSYTNGNQLATFNLYLNATLGGSPSYTNVNANTSVVSYDTAGTTVSGGKLVGTYYSNTNQSNALDISAYYIILNPGDTLTVAGTSAGPSVTCYASLMWNEQF